MQFCGTCTPTDEILAYIEGRSHVLPVYGDRAQQRTATSKRQVLFFEKLKKFDPEVVDWPEYRAMSDLTRHTNRLIAVAGTLTNSRNAPESLKAALAADKARIIASKEPNRRRFVTRNDQRRVVRNWVRQNLAEAEMFLLGRYCYAEPSVTQQSMLLAA